MTMFRVGPAGIPTSLKTDMNSVLNKKFGTTGQNYPPNGWPDDVNLMGPLPEGTATGPIASISDGADRVPIKSWNVNIDPNLTGKSSVVCTQAGKNLFDKTNTSGIVTGYIDTVSFNTGNQNAKTIYIPIKGGETYTVSKTAGVRFVIATSENIPSSGALYTIRKANNTASSLYITADVNDKYLWAWVFLDGTDTGTIDDMLASVQIEVGSTSTTYTPYIAPTVSNVNLGQTIYGGSADVVNGAGTEEYVKIVFDGSDDEGWGKTNAGPYYTTLTGYYKEQGFTNGICDSFAMVPEVGLASNLTTDLTCSFYFGSDQNRFYIRYDAMTNVDALKTWLSQNPVTVVYKVATGTDFTFDPITPTPQTPESHSANFWADTGDSTVVYRRDIDLALQALSGTRNLLMTSIRPEVSLDNDPEQLERTENPTEEEGDTNNER